MGYSEAIEQVARLFNGILDLILRRKNPKTIQLPIPDDNSIDSTICEKFRALQTLSEDIQWEDLQREDSPHMKTNMCWALQLTFRKLRLSRDAEEIFKILSSLRKLLSEKALKRFSHNCPGLPSMVHSLSRCSALYDDANEIHNLTPENEKQIANDVLEVCRNLLLPITKRRKKAVLYADMTVALGSSLKVFTKTLTKYSDKWPEDLEDQIKRTVQFVPSVLRKIELRNKGIKDGLVEFANQIPICLVRLTTEHRDRWLPTLQTLCSKTAPDLPSPLCRIWKRLTVVSKFGGFRFLNNLLQSTFETVWSQIETNVEEDATDDNEAEYIIGCMNSLLEQCCSWEPEHLGDHWHSKVQPVIKDYMLKRQEGLTKHRGPVQDYLDRMITHMDSARDICAKAKSPTEIRSMSRRKRKRPFDSLYGLVYSD